MAINKKETSSKAAAAAPKASKDQGTAKKTLTASAAAPKAKKGK